MGKFVFINPSIIMKKTLLFVFSMLLALSPVAYASEIILGPGTTATSTSASPVFTRNLTIGMSGQDVSALNKILGLEFNTTIANPSVFGQSTQSYLTKLQERYAAEILTPNGLTAGTGSVGPATIAELNTLAQEYNIKLSDFPAPVQTAAPSVPQVFTQTLSLGSVSDQVILLKTILNSDPATALVYTNAAEQSDPADLFDAATQAAVIRFQEKYASSILAPLGLSKGNGIVGPATIAKLNQLLSSVSASFIQQGNTSNVTAPVYTAPITNPNTVVNSCTTDLFTCGEWGACVNGTQTRTCQITYACQNPGANHNLNQPTSQSCTAAATPAPTTQTITIPAGTTVATGELDVCTFPPNKRCSIGNGHNAYYDAATCDANNANNPITCPSGSTVKQTNSPSMQPSNDSWCAGGGGFTPPSMIVRFMFSCVSNADKTVTVPVTSATPATLTQAQEEEQARMSLNPTLTSGSSGGGGIIGGIGQIVGGVVSGVGSIVGGILSIF